MKINQIGITLYDNKPSLPANRWYEVSENKETAKNRYKLELNFLHKGSPIKLRSAMQWPPNQLRRLSYWEQHEEFYESIVKRADEINCQIRSGIINSHMPVVLAFPNMNERFTTKNNSTHFKWVLPQQPSAIIAIREQIIPGFYQWKLNWVSKIHEQEFVMNNDCRADDVPGRRIKNQSTRLYKPFLGPFDIADTLITADYSQQVYVSKAVVDDEYEAFKVRVKYLFDCGTALSEEEAHRVMSKHPEYTNRYLNELQ